MKYKLLLVGKNKSLINDFFMQMDIFFECLTSSLRYADLLCHVKYFKPHAVVFCMNAENRDDIITMNNLHNHLEKSKIPFIIICDCNDYDLFTKLAGSKEDLLLVKPLTLVTIQERILAFLHKSAPQEQSQTETYAESSIDTEKTLNLLSQLEKALSLPETDLDNTASGENAKSAEHPQRVMIIDDAPGMLKAIKEHLSPEYEVATAISGKIALKYLQNKTVDLIFLDYAMPEEDGPAVFEKLLANPNTANIPVVFLTGINDSALIQKALSLKPKGYLLKPVDKETLLAKVHEILG